jgi:hypothetical protein
MAVVVPSLTGTYYGSFNASGQTQYLTVPSNAAFQFGTGNFTIEFWVKFNNVVDQQALVDMRSGVGAAIAPVIYLFTNSKIYYYAGAADRIISSQTVQANLWYHIAVVRSSSVTTMFINGNKTGSTYADTNTYIINSPWIGRFNNGVTGLTLMLNGQMSNLRIVKGTALYTDTFVVPTGPLTAVSGTSLLTLQDSTVIDKGTANAGSPFTITNIGTVTTALVTDTGYAYNTVPIIKNTSTDTPDNPTILRKNTVLFNDALSTPSYHKIPILKNTSTENWYIFDPIPTKNQYYMPPTYQFWS